jgi:hypothetical protein
MSTVVNASGGSLDADAISERNVHECQKQAPVSAAPRTGVLGRDPEPDDEARVPRPTKKGPSASRSGLYERAVQSSQEYRQQGNS